MNQIQLFQQSLGVTPDGDIGRKTLEAFRRKYNKNKEQTAHFFGQTAHETGNFKVFEENLLYSASRLRQVFPQYFPTNTLANAYARNPKMIASRAYANRMGNGDEASGDGYEFLGRGALQLTGKNNYLAFYDYINKCVKPDLIATVYAFETALFYFDKNNIWKDCNGISSENIKKVSKRINGGYNGLSDRITKTGKYYSIQL